MREDSRYSLRHENVLFVGIGGGNGIFSTVLAMSVLRHLGWSWERCAIAGMLSPFHDHDVTVTGARCLRVVHRASKRFIPTHKDEPERRIGFIDVQAHRMANEALSHCETVYGLDLRGGSHNLVTSFKRLALRYDRIVLVDLGGDCLYRGREDAHVLSPMFDAIALRAFVDAKVPGLLFVAGPGTDGELEPKPLRQTLFDVGAEPHALPEACIDKLERLYKTYVERVRPGHTVPNTILAYRSSEPFIEVTHGPQAIAANVTYCQPFIQRISTELCKQYYLIDPRKIRNPFMLRCTGAKDWYLKTQLKQSRTSCEADLQHLRVDKEIWRFASPSPLYATNFRRMIMRAVMYDFHISRTDGLWFLPDDWDLLDPDSKSNLIATPEDGLIAVRRYV